MQQLLVRRLQILDLSFNNFSGDLPPSFGSLLNLSSLFLQKNQLTGPLGVLVGLPLDTLEQARCTNLGRLMGTHASQLLRASYKDPRSWIVIFYLALYLKFIDLQCNSKLVIFIYLY